ncbi:MAG: ABC transporter permease [Alphaproteobacteria bacterium]|nr:ABC transporter permease [Alphaproteobacteria bacterium]
MMRQAGFLILALAMLFLLGPFLIIAGAGLSAGDILVFPPQGLSLRWFIAILDIERFRVSFLLSLELAIISTGLSLLMGVPAAYALARYDVPFRETMRTIITSPVIVPAIIAGLALLRYAVIPLGLPVMAALILGHTALVAPYAVRVVSVSLTHLRVDVEEAAILLGTTRSGAFFRIVLPNIKNGMMAAFILGFITSFNQVPVSLFLTGPGISTLPIDMLGAMEFVYDPSIAALSTLLALLTILIVLLAERLLGLSRYV